MGTNEKLRPDDWIDAHSRRSGEREVPQGELEDFSFRSAANAARIEDGGSPRQVSGMPIHQIAEATHKQIASADDLRILAGHAVLIRNGDEVQGPIQ